MSELIDETHPLIAEKKRRFSPGETRMIREDIKALLDRYVIKLPKSPWTAHVLCVGKRTKFCDFAWTNGNSRARP